MAFSWARALAIDSRLLADSIVAAVRAMPERRRRAARLRRIEAAGPGFLNLWLRVREPRDIFGDVLEDSSAVRGIPPSADRRIVVSWECAPSAFLDGCDGALQDEVHAAVLAEALKALLARTAEVVRLECFIRDTRCADAAQSVPPPRLAATLHAWGVHPDSYYPASSLFEDPEVRPLLAGPQLSRSRGAAGIDVTSAQGGAPAYAGGLDRIRLAYTCEAFRRGFQRLIQLGPADPAADSSAFHAAVRALGHDAGCREWVSPGRTLAPRAHTEGLGPLPVSRERTQAGTGVTGPSEELRLRVLCAGSALLRRPPGYDGGLWRDVVCCDHLLTERIRGCERRDLSAWVRSRAPEADRVEGVQGLADRLEGYSYYSRRAVSERRPDLLARYTLALARWLLGGFGATAGALRGRQVPDAPVCRLDAGPAAAARRILRSGIEAIGLELPTGG